MNNQNKYPTKTFEQPLCKVVRFDYCDVITTSLEDGYYGFGTINANEDWDDANYD